VIVGRRRRWCVASLAATLLVSMAACTAAPTPAPSVNPAYESQLQEALDSTQSDFTRKILADLDISNAEYEEATDKYVLCMNDRGVDAAKSREGNFYGFSVPMGAGSEDIEAECYSTYMDPVAVLYISMATNPDDEDWFALMAACLVNKGVVDSTFTKEDYEKLDAGVPEAGKITLDSPEVAACRLDPKS